MSKDPDKNLFKDKKVLVFGLGLLGGGVATTNWLLKHGAKVTVTDLKNKKQLALSLKQIKGPARLAGASSPKLKLGGHDENDIVENDVIVFNPDVPVTSKYVELAKKLSKDVENEATIFYKLCKKPIIAVTGTRGKTTTANWIAHLLNAKFKTVVTGNAAPGFVQPLLKTLDSINKVSIVVNEMPNFHLEYFDSMTRPSETAVITNIFQDHLNRYASFADYVKTKANIFKNQNEKQNLVLNYDNGWTSFLLGQKPKSKVLFFSEKTLPAKFSGVFYKNDSIYFQKDGEAKKALDIRGFSDAWGRHNLQNLLAAALTTYLNGVPWIEIKQRIKTLPQIPFRQEVIFDGSVRLGAVYKKIKIINDTSATSPDGGIAAVKRFGLSAGKAGSPSCILITGGTDRQLDYKEWGAAVAKRVRPENIVMIGGSATAKMLKALGNIADKIHVSETLIECIRLALDKAGKYDKSVVLFSPAAKSFEKFKNEYDRGEQFNALVRKELKWTQFSKKRTK